MILVLNNRSKKVGHLIEYLEKPDFNLKRDRYEMKKFAKVQLRDGRKVVWNAENVISERRV